MSGFWFVKVKRWFFRVLNYFIAILCAGSKAPIHLTHFGWNRQTQPTAPQLPSQNPSQSHASSISKLCHGNNQAGQAWPTLAEFLSNFTFFSFHPLDPLLYLGFRRETPEAELGNTDAMHNLTKVTAITDLSTRLLWGTKTHRDFIFSLHCLL